MINLTWHIEDEIITNWGDCIAPFITKFISKDEKINYVNYNDYTSNTIFVICGSIIELLINPNIIIWGAGCMYEHSSISIKPIVTAVRGPLTRNNLLKYNIDCPEIYGDLALLFPKFYNPDVDKKYKLGIIPHYIDKNVSWITNIHDQDVLIIYICSGITEFIDQLKQCDKIISSSLHGIIAADAYDIPSLWIQLSENVFGNGFKFRDYFASVNRLDNKPYIIHENTNLIDVYNAIPNYTIDIDLDLLYNACPFKMKL